MSNSVKLTTEDVNGAKVAFVTFHSESKVNILSSAILNDLDEMLSDLAKDKKLRAVVFASDVPGNFIAGADINEIASLTTEDDALTKVKQGQKILNKITELPKTVAFLNGTCMGGGLELALACKYRIAVNDDKINFALPEVKLGILPGFGGSQRLPALVGIQNALPIMLEGRNVKPKKAVKIGLVDKLVSSEKLSESQFADILHDILDGKLKKRKYKPNLIDRLLSIPLADDLVFRMIEKKVAKVAHKGYPAPFTILQLLKKTYRCSITMKNALRLERTFFAELATSEASKNLIYLYFANQNLKKDFSGLADFNPPQKSLVIGAGIMGGGIANLFAGKNLPITMKDISWVGIETAFTHIYKVLSSKVRARKLKSAEAENIKSRITPVCGDISPMNAEFAVEAVFENLDVKHTVLKDLEDKLPESGIIATNTSSLTLGDIGANMERKNRFVGFHFFNPVEKMPLVEIVKHPETDVSTVQYAVSLARYLGKTPVVVGDCAGFVVNRLLLPYMNEALLCLEEVGETSKIVEIDKIFTDFGMPMGPFRLADEVGLDIAYKVSNNLSCSYGSRMQLPKTLEEVNERKLLGKKGGLGFYVFKNGKQVNPNISFPLKKTVAKVISSETILSRCTHVMINEAFKILSEGIVKKEEHLDICMVFGAGFPPFRGGLIKYARSIGLPQIVENLKGLQEKFGDRFEPDAYLVKLAEGNKPQETFAPETVSQESDNTTEDENISQ